MGEERLVDHSGADNDGPQQICETDPSYYGGVLNESIQEPLPRRINTTGEKVLNRGNSWIVLGRDRIGSRPSGYGGAGATQASAIDLCVGMGGPTPAGSEHVDPNFKGDSARIYISQRSNIDEAFRLTSAVGPNQSDSLSNSDIGYPENQSAIGIKADSVRVIGTNGIKLITRPQNKDSRDGNASFAGIELAAGNDEEELQYMVKGENLIDSLSELEERITDISAVLMTFLTTQIKVNARLCAHTHTVYGPPSGNPIGTAAPNTPLFTAAGNAVVDELEGVIDNLMTRINLNIFWHNKYLNAMSSKYILSKYNKVN